MFSQAQVLSIFLCWTIILLVNCSNVTTNEQFLSQEEFIKWYLEPHVEYWANYTDQSCRNEGFAFDKDSAKSKFYACTLPQFLNYTLEEINLLDQTIQDLVMILEDDSQKKVFGSEFLEHLKSNISVPICSHIPIILNCFYNEFIEGIYYCWSPRSEFVINYLNQILPSICEYGGIKFEGLLTLEGQKCVANYKGHVDVCINAVNSNWNSRNRNDFCDFLPCLRRVGQSSPCEDENSEIILKYLFDDAQLSRKCVLKAYIHEEIEMECKESEINPEQKHYVDIENCFSPFISAYYYLSLVSNSTVQNTSYGNYVYDNLHGNFEEEATKLCEIFESDSCNSSKQLVQECYSSSAPYRGFLTYFEYLVEIQCSNNGADIKEMLVHDKLECLQILVEELVSCTESLEDLSSKEVTEIIKYSGSCGALKFFQNCSSTTLIHTCKNPESLAILQNLINEIDFKINTTDCLSSILRDEENSSPMVNQEAPRYAQQAVLMYILLGILGVVFIFVVVSISCKRLMPFRSIPVAPESA